MVIVMWEYLWKISKQLRKKLVIYYHIIDSLNC